MGTACAFLKERGFELEKLIEAQGFESCRCCLMLLMRYVNVQRHENILYIRHDNFQSLEVSTVRISLKR